MAKLLIVRFSSFGDILQGISIPQHFRKKFPESEVHWVTRWDFKDVVALNPQVNKIWAFDRRGGLQGLLRLSRDLSREGFTHIYDAHNNLRSHILCGLLKAPHFLRRPKHRLKRLLLFRFHQNLFPKPFVGRQSYLEPLQDWGISSEVLSSSIDLSKINLDHLKPMVDWEQSFIALIPSTAWPMKNWPLQHWKRLLELRPHQNYVILGGAKDKACFELHEHFASSGQKVINLAGALSLQESCALLAQAKLVISADTGLMHVADELGKKVIALVGPTAFGYPHRSSSRVLEVDLPCKPCSKDGRGKCINTVYQRCMLEIAPEKVAEFL